MIPPYTPPSWTTILSGVNLTKHEIIGFQKLVKMRDGLKIKYTSACDVKYPRIFEILALERLKNIVINVPMSYPFRCILSKRNLIIVSDWASPIQCIWPRKIEKEYKEYLTYPPWQYKRYKDKREYAKRVDEYLKERLNIYLDLLGRDDWNLYTIIFSEIDWINSQ